MKFLAQLFAIIAAVSGVALEEEEIEETDEISLKEQQIFFKKMILSQPQNKYELKDVLSCKSISNYSIKQLVDRSQAVILLFIGSYGNPFIFQEVLDIYGELETYEQLKINVIIISPESNEKLQKYLLSSKFKYHTSIIHAANDKDKRLKKALKFDSFSLTSMMPSFLTKNKSINKDTLSKHNSLIGQMFNMEKKCDNIGLFFIKGDEILGELRLNGQEKNQNRVSIIVNNEGVTVKNMSSSSKNMEKIDINIKLLKNGGNKKIKLVDEDKDIKMIDMINDNKYKENFRNFLKNERAEENLLFIDDVDVYKSLKKDHNRKCQIEKIMEKYFNRASEYQINISGINAMKIAEFYEKEEFPDKLFEPALIEVQESLDSNYRRFLLTKAYESILKNGMSLRNF